MLITGQIPNREPLIRVGIVLPEDAQKTLRIHFDGVFQIQLDELALAASEKSLQFHCADGKIRVESPTFSGEGQKISLYLEEENGSFWVEPVRAGRSFHWEKEIRVQLSHRIDLFIHSGFLLLINELPLENYLACVATSEMSAECPESFLQAQSIVARSWMLANIEQKHRHLNFDVCNDDCCQRFQGISQLNEYALKQSLSTRGIVLMYEDQICDARYSKSCGGVMEKFENLWEGNALDYMQNLPDSPQHSLPDLTDEKVFEDWVQSNPKSYCSPHYISEEKLPKYLGKVDEGGKYFRWTIEVTQEELCRNINRHVNINAKAIIDLEVLARAGSGRMLQLKVSYLNEDDSIKEFIVHKDYKARQILHPDFLYSSACTIQRKKGDTQFPDFIYRGAGWGHGAGLCQIGALGMALAGIQSEEILSHYYPGSLLKKIYA